MASSSTWGTNHQVKAGMYMKCEQINYHDKWSRLHIVCVFKSWVTTAIYSPSTAHSFVTRHCRNKQHSEINCETLLIDIKTVYCITLSLPEILWHTTVWRTWLFIAYLIRWKIIIPILTTSPIHFPLNGWENVLLHRHLKLITLGSERVNIKSILLLNIKLILGLYYTE